MIWIDEFHEYKNSAVATYEQVEKLRSAGRNIGSARPIIGLTGTPMQNKHKELWSLSQLVDPSAFGKYKDFQLNYENPIKLSRKRDASDRDIVRGDEASRALREKLKTFHLARKKEDVLKGTLKGKDENIIFCEMSELQKEVYQRILALPDFQCVKRADEPCDCGVNQHTFEEFLRLQDMGKSDKELSLFMKDRDIIQRKICCGNFPILNKRIGRDDYEIHPDAVIWLKQHPNKEPCKLCPTCTGLPCLSKLHKLCNHVSLLQVKAHPDDMDPLTDSEVEINNARYNLKFAELIFANGLVDHLPGSSFVRGSRITDDHHALSGKLSMLSTILKKFKRKNDRCLVFSLSTQCLDVIEKWVQSAGYKYLRLDGGTPSANRQALVDRYQHDSDIFLFLISTRAGGMGLNLTAANRVVIYDVNWNPAYDEQAQDRSYRIGQKRDVQIYRLVTRGSIEELMYMRQVYKSHLKKQTLEGSQEGDGKNFVRLFMGVADDRDNRGELYGNYNLLKYKDGSFMTDTWASFTNDQRGREDGLEGVPVISDDDFQRQLVNGGMLQALENEGSFKPQTFMSRVSRPTSLQPPSSKGSVGEGEEQFEGSATAVAAGAESTESAKQQSQSMQSLESEQKSQAAWVNDFLRTQSQSSAPEGLAKLSDRDHTRAAGGNGNNANAATRKTSSSASEREGGLSKSNDRNRDRAKVDDGRKSNANTTISSPAIKCESRKDVTSSSDLNRARVVGRSINNASAASNGPSQISGSTAVTQMSLAAKKASLIAPSNASSVTSANLRIMGMYTEDLQEGNDAVENLLYNPEYDDTKKEKKKKKKKEKKEKKEKKDKKERKKKKKEMNEMGAKGREEEGAEKNNAESADRELQPQTNS